MTARAIKNQHDKSSTRRHVSSCRTLYALAAGLLMICQYAATASAQSPSRIVPLPTPAPSNAKPGNALAKTAKQPPPDIWSASEIADARRVCTNALKSMSAKIIELPPIKKSRCGSPAPVRLISIGKKNPIKFVPAPTISCGMLVPLKRWIDKGLQPAAARNLDTRVTTVTVMSSYSCRTRYGRKGARMSEHAFANALDIGGFRLADGGRVSVLKDWGLTRRDITKAIAAAKAAQPQPARAEPTVAPISSLPPRANRQQSRSRASSSRTRVALPEVRIDARSASRRTEDRPGKRRVRELSRPGGQRRATVEARLPAPLDRPTRRRRSLDQPAQSGAFGERVVGSSPPPLPVRRPLRRAVGRRVNLKPPIQPSGSNRRRSPPSQADKFKSPYRLGGPKPGTSAPRAIFLRSIHKTACRIFGTTLGPEANEAHRNHFNFDMFPRKRRGYCE